jgi:hypothetical protein
MATWTITPVPGVLDPYLYWAQETQNAYLAGAGNAEPLWIPLIIELKAGAQRTARNFAALVLKKREWVHAIRLSPLYLAPPAGMETASYCTALVTQAFFEPRILQDPDLRAFIGRFEIGLPVPGYQTPVPRPAAAAEKANKQMKKKKKALPIHRVVTAVIDDGLGFSHGLFRQGALSTRVEYFWNQDGVAELTRAAIANALAGCDHGGLVDEDELYAATGSVNYAQPGHKPIAQRASHGTHVMDIACADRPPPFDATGPVIGVQLPVAITADTSGATLTPYALDALWYILNRADAVLSPPARVVVNLSYGTIAGPHDGSSVLEKAMDEMIQLRKPRLQIVLPAGNSHLARCHARFDLGKGKEQPLRWRLPPDDRTPSFQEIWLPKSTKSNKRQVELRVIPPDGDASGWIKEGEEHIWQPGNDLLCKVLYLPQDPARPRSMIFIAVAPTTTLHPTREVAPSGTWTIRIRNAAAKPVTLDAWIQRDDTPFGYPRHGRESRFEDPDYEYRDDAGREIEEDNDKSYIRRDGTLNAIATGAETIVLGGYRRKDKRAAKYSARGVLPTPHGGIDIRAPDAMTVSDDSAAFDGLLAAGSRTRSIVAINGTSVSAPQIARWAAKRMAAGQSSSRAAVHTQATPTPIPAKRSGAGLIEFSPLVDRKIEP